MTNGYCSNRTHKVLLFSLFIFLFNMTYAQTYQDCETPYHICNLDSYHFSTIQGYGSILENVDNQRCFEGTFRETNSYWLSWDISKSGVLGFVIDPLNQADDFDFVLFRSSGNNCDELEEVRCVTTGLNMTNRPHNDADCVGRTGLSVRSIDEFETTGCKYNDDNYVKLLNAEVNEKYYLLVNNFNSSAGFSIHFSGDTDFKSDEKCSDLENATSLQGVNLYPNPASTKINMEYYVLNNATVFVELIDFFGRRLSMNEYNPTIGKNIETLDISNLASGNYFLHMVQDQISTVKPFTKN